jgi:hypothetical protein
MARVFSLNMVSVPDSDGLADTTAPEDIGPAKPRENAE